MMNKNKKTKLIMLRATPDDRSTLESLAAAEGRSLSNMIRELIRRAAVMRGICPAGTA